MVDAVADDRTVSTVDELGEDRVHHVVVDGPPSAGAVSPTLAGGELDLEERPMIQVRLGDVDDEEVRKNQLRQRVTAAIPVRRPVDPAVEPVPESEVRVQPGPVGTRYASARLKASSML